MGRDARESGVGMLMEYAVDEKPTPSQDDAQMKAEPEQPPRPTRGVPIEIGGETHYLRYPLKVMKKMRATFGDKAMEEGVRTDRISQLLLFGLQHENDPKITLDWIENEVDLEMLPSLMKAVTKATGGKSAAAETQVVQPQSPEKSS